MPCSIELLSTRENKARKSRICLRGEKRKKNSNFARVYKEICLFFKNFIEKFGSRVFSRDQFLHPSITPPVLLFTFL